LSRDDSGLAAMANPSDHHAYRCLGNRWLAIAWKLWQTGQTYDETYHLQQRALRSRPKT